MHWLSNYFDSDKYNLYLIPYTYIHMNIKTKTKVSQDNTVSFHFAVSDTLKITLEVMNRSQIKCWKNCFNKKNRGFEVKEPEINSQLYGWSALLSWKII